MTKVNVSSARVRARVRRIHVVLSLLSIAACTSPNPEVLSAKGARRAADGNASGLRDAGSGLDLPVNEGGSLLPEPDAAKPAAITLVVMPETGKRTIDLTDPKPIQFTAERSDGAASASQVAWSCDNKALGTIDPETGEFKPTGAAGVIKVVARAGSLSATSVVTLRVRTTQEGDPGLAEPVGAGGLGGVGGDGPGTKIDDPALRAALDANPKQDAGLQWLYPYDGTVWPRGLPAPLLQWKHGDHAPRAVKIHIEVDAPAFVYDGYFGPPAALAADAPIDRLLIPQGVWRSALQSGAHMKVSVTIAASDGSGGFASYAFEHDRSWPVAPASLKGVVYYNSYGTKLVENSNGASGGNGRFGGATLAITAGAFDPTLVAGSNSDDESGCRVCHTVSADGSLMIAQQAMNTVSSAYDLKNMNQERMFTDADRGKFGWAALSPDGKLALGNAGPPGDIRTNVASLGTSALYRVSDAAMLTANGLNEFVTQAAMPTFSPDGKKVAFNLNAGPGNANIQADGNSLVVMDFSKVDDTTYEFSNPVAVFTSKGGDERPGWPGFLPDASGVVFELELKPGQNNELFVTRGGARGELWWADLDGNAHALDRANGQGYLPTGPMGHDDDTTLQYEPTVAPIVAGGYAWVVFTSRRLYGNVATREPFESDPRHFDLTEGNPGGPTTKKLWVTAIDMPPKPGADPSHPAFYLPAQELYAGNSRGFWVLDACREKGKACDSGDQCCGGYCRALDEFSVTVCDDTPPGKCAKEYDSCNVTADCCRDGDKVLQCIAGRCAELSLF